ncbi:MAG: hypothetical protein JXR76_06190 [Deltaproteobacteria bacterium]|nr:hypothetical protein [Deltaproteobacteria bacterium]
MKCLNESQMSRYFSGDISRREAEAFGKHITSCQRCLSLGNEFSQIATQLKSDNAAYHSGAEIHKIVTIIDVGKANTISIRGPRIDRMRALWAVAAALIAGFVVGAIWLGVKKKDADTADVNDQFHARADGAPNGDTFVSLQIFENKNGTYQRVSDTISPSASLAFKYKDYSRHPYRYLMILAVDETAGIFWYYPSYIDALTNPQSISLRAQKGEFQLPDEVSHKYTPGLIDMIAIFSRTPLHVQAIEQDIARRMKLRPDVKRLEQFNIRGAAHYVKTLKVETKK